MGAGYMQLTVHRPHEHVAVITLNRPDRLNALTDLMFAELGEVCSELGADRGVRAIVLTGAGRGFCAGLDLDEAAALPELDATDFYAAQQRWAASVAAIAATPQPVIAAVNGAAAGAGLSIAAMCDLRLAAPTARFNAAFVRIGLSGGDCGISWTLPRIVGTGHAAEMLYTGRFVDAEEAARMALVNRVVDADVLVAVAVDLGAQIAGNSPFGVRLTKSILQANAGAGSLAAAIELENRSQVLTVQTQDMVEALHAFRAKRDPVFRDR